MLGSFPRISSSIGSDHSGHLSANHFPLHFCNFLFSAWAIKIPSDQSSGLPTVPFLSEASQELLCLTAWAVLKHRTYDNRSIVSSCEYWLSQNIDIILTYACKFIFVVTTDEQIIWMTWKSNQLSSKFVEFEIITIFHFSILISSVAFLDYSWPSTRKDFLGGYSFFGLNCLWKVHCVYAASVSWKNTYCFSVYNMYIDSGVHCRIMYPFALSVMVLQTFPALCDRVRLFVSHSVFVSPHPGIQNKQVIPVQDSSPPKLL